MEDMAPSKVKNRAPSKVKNSGWALSCGIAMQKQAHTAASGAIHPFTSVFSCYTILHKSLHVWGWGVKALM